MSKKVLVVDDQAMIVMVIQKLLEINGYEVITSDNGMNVATIIEAQHPDLLVIDILMPEQDGLETILSLRHKYPNLIIIAISSNKHYLKVAKLFGANASYAKPINDDAFVSLIAQF